jgi:hypothetical protein
MIKFGTLKGQYMKYPAINQPSIIMGFGRYLAELPTMSY